jgi:vanillate O-demethylase monooxygenase subunit
MATDKENITADKPFALKLAGEEIVLYRDTRNDVVAMADLCPHRLAPLSIGRVEGDDIRCMYHGIKFGSDGLCKEVPGQDVVPKTFCVKLYAVVEGPEWVWVWIGDQTKVDESLVPDQYFHNSDLFKVRKGSVPFAASFELFNDNTCDLSHVAFVHEATLGKVGEDEWAYRQPEMFFLDDSVEVNRWMEGIEMPQIPGQKVDFSTRSKHVLPGVFIMDLQAHPVGTAKKLNYGGPTDDMTAIYQSATIQTASPRTETTSQFHFSIMVPHSVPDEFLDAEFEFAKSGFAEDKMMCEAQQRAITAHPNERLRMTSHDKAGVHFRKLIRATAAN